MDDDHHAWSAAPARTRARGSGAPGHPPRAAPGSSRARSLESPNEISSKANVAQGHEIAGQRRTGKRLAAPADHVVRERLERVAVRRRWECVQLLTGPVAEGLRIAVRLLDPARTAHDTDHLRVVRILQRRLFQDGLQSSVEAWIMAGEHQRERPRSLLQVVAAPLADLRLRGEVVEDGIGDLE